MTEPRKASEVILKLEEKLDVALGLIRAQDLTIKILSNKLNSILEVLEKKAADVPKFTVEAISNTRPPAPVVLPPSSSPFQQAFPVEADKQIPISSDFNLPVESEPKGFRRTSRPETFAGDDAYLPQSTSAVNKMQQAQQAPPGRGPSGPPPGRSVAEALVPQAPPKKVEAPKQPKQSKIPAQVVQNAIPVEQRVVNAHGKSLYLADVEIIDLSNMQSVFKTRTNGMGKWMAALGVGGYRIIIRRMEPTTKERMEVTQDIEVDGTQSPLTLPSIIVKPS